MWQNHVLPTLCWIVYCILHSVLAAPPVKAWFLRKMGRQFSYYRIYYVLFAFLSFAGLIGFEIGMTTVALFWQRTGVLLTGIILSFSGLVLMLVCIGKYFISLSGLKSIFEERPKASLMITGVHRYVRHPLYLGTFVFIWGLWLVLPLLSLLLSNIVITVYTLIGLRFEEHKLLSEFGAQYGRYQQEVPRLLPLSRPKRKA